MFTRLQQTFHSESEKMRVPEGNFVRHSRRNRSFPELIDLWSQFETANVENSLLLDLVRDIESEKSEDGESLIKEAQAEIDELVELIDSLDVSIQHKISDMFMDLAEGRSPGQNGPEGGDCDAIMEIHPAAGGEEASLFAFDLFNMYKKHCLRKGWSWDVMSHSISGGGLKDVSVCIGSKGTNVLGKLRYENGIHRVQRVPKTESAGRIHTSTVAVVVFPDAKLADVDIPQSEIKVETFRSGGHGGQHVNTTDSAVRLTHIPTGVTASIQDERSQHQNLRKALRLLRARVFKIKSDSAQKERHNSRLSSIGTGERSEKIRTYNFPQGRVTDHRCNFSLFDMESALNGLHLDEFLTENKKKAATDVIKALESATDEEWKEMWAQVI